MEDKIREVLYQSMSCRFKKLVVRKFLSEEYAVVHIETFVKELVKKLKGEDNGKEGCSEA